MIRTKTHSTYVCDNCKAEASDEVVSENAIDSRYASYGADFSVDVKHKLPAGWTFTELKKMVCGLECLKELWDKHITKTKDEEVLKYSEKFINNLKK